VEYVTEASEAESGAQKPLPLDGIRICDFSWIVAGPQATRIFADLGAEVIKVENESYLDSIRMARAPDGPPSFNASGFHNNFHRNKLGITANVHHPEGREAVERLIGISDIVVENFSAGAFARMGFPYERLREVKPDIIYLSLSGFGHVGRDASYVTWGPTAAGASGATAMSGMADDEPAGWGYSYLDHTAGFYGAIALLMALYHRDRTGEGQHIDMAQVETGMVLGGVPMLDYQVNGREYTRTGNHSRAPAIAPHAIYRCAADGDNDDRWIAIVAESEDQWRELCAGLGVPDLAADPRYLTNEGRVAEQEALDAAINSLTRGREAHELMYELQARGVPAGVCQTAEDRMEKDPQLAERSFYRTAHHGEMGTHRFEGLPMQFSRGRWRMDRGAPLIGEDTHRVLTELLGYSDEDAARLASEAAV
jgi:crotonobetainyl-CoA:carnitine CoA-transferase CaiB-like acyl-CoA transferase